MKLLVPVDGSSASINAVKKSIEIAKKYGFSIKLISVVKSDYLARQKRYQSSWSQLDGSIIQSNDELPKEFETVMMENNDIIEKVEESSKKLLDSIVSELDFINIKVEKEVLIGEPYVKILETAKNEKFDLIVMGNRGFSKIKRFFIGSVTQRVISEAPCPVLVIHTDAAI